MNDVLTAKDRLVLAWLGEHPYSWGAHVKRGDPITDPDMVRWVNFGLIEYHAPWTPTGNGGYTLTDKGRAALRQPQAA